MKKQNKQRNLLLSLILLVLFVFFVVGIMLWENSRPGIGMTAEQPPTQTTGAAASAPETQAATLPPQTSTPVFASRRINFLLVGRDAHGEGENGRSDSMILCSVDTGTKTVSLISFLRDLYVQIPDHGSNRLNAAYSWGGAELLKETLKENFHVDVDATLEIDFDGYEELIDLLGGVDITLTDREAEHLNGGNGWSLTSGVNHLDGAQALAYARIRYLDSDFVRTERQRNVLTGLLHRYQDASFQEMLQVTDALLDRSTSDHSDEELLGYALELYSMLEEHQLISCRIPADGTYTYETIRGMSVIEADLEENRELLASLLG